MTFELTDMLAEAYSFLKYIFALVPPVKAKSAIFGFSQFVGTMSLFIVLYNITDERFRFRAKTAPLPLKGLTFVLFILLGFISLISDFWFNEELRIPYLISNQGMIQVSMATVYFSLICTWIFFAFVRPPIFSRGNAKKFYHEINNIILLGTENELRIIANELSRSMKNVVKYAGQHSKTNKKSKVNENKFKPTTSVYAQNLLLLIGTRKLCRYVAVDTPVTAIILFEEMKQQHLYHLPAKQFAHNTFAEALANKDSILYHEDSEWQSGLLGYFKSFKNSLFGDYELVERLSSNGNGPLDLGFTNDTKWEAKEFSVYSECFLIFFQSYFEFHKERGNFSHSYALYSALNLIYNACRDAYKLENMGDDYWLSNTFLRLEKSANIVKNILCILRKEQTVPSSILLRNKRSTPNPDNFLDQIVNCMVEIILSASHVKSDTDRCWIVQYSAVWSKFIHDLEDNSNKYIDAIMFRLRRRIFDKIVGVEIFNYESARLLGFCLNVMGLQLCSKTESYLDKNYRALHKVLLRWTQKNFLVIYARNPDLAEKCIMGSITLDLTNKRLIKTFTKILNSPAHQEFLTLCEHPN